jgi:hypothetical protein
MLGPPRSAPKYLICTSSCLVGRTESEWVSSQLLKVHLMRRAADSENCGMTGHRRVTVLLACRRHKDGQQKHGEPEIFECRCGVAFLNRGAPVTHQFLFEDPRLRPASAMIENESDDDQCDAAADDLDREKSGSGTVGRRHHGQDQGEQRYQKPRTADQPTGE